MAPVTLHLVSRFPFLYGSFWIDFVIQRSEDKPCKMIQRSSNIKFAKDLQWNIEVHVSHDHLSNLAMTTSLTWFVIVTPTTVRKLLESGFVVNVERSPVRIFDDKEFEDAGAHLVPTSSWRNAPRDHIIIGLKELPEEACMLFKMDLSGISPDVTRGQSTSYTRMYNLRIATKAKQDGKPYWGDSQKAVERYTTLNFSKILRVGG